ncbi:Phloem protein 2-like - like 1 [Theobroma cacao]|nr:Phloem protein 2-like - like 1 [Theobroma cacao]
MGANISGAVADGDGDGPPSRPRLGDIPESCAALVLAQLDPPEICKLSRLNRSFCGASSADFIWESKLPSNYRFIVEKVLRDTTLLTLQRKELYARLCRPILFDAGTKEIWLDKSTGGVCLSIASKALTITGIDDRRYWSHISTEESRCVYHLASSDFSLCLSIFTSHDSRVKEASNQDSDLRPRSTLAGIPYPTVAYLQQIWWFEVDGELEFQFPAGTYCLFFRLQLGKSSKRLGRRFCNAEHVHGWDIKPARFQLTTSDGQRAVSQCYLDNPGNWVLYHVGDFIVENPNALTKIKFSMTQIDCTHTKGGLCVDTALIYPSSVGKEFRSSCP